MVRDRGICSFALPMVLLVTAALLTGIALAGSDRDGGIDRDTDAGFGRCQKCQPMTPVVFSSRHIRGGEGLVEGVVHCQLINSQSEYDTFCIDQNVPDCPVLPAGFFDSKTLSVVIIDTFSPRPCDVVAEPTWSVECMRVTGGKVFSRVVVKHPGTECICTLPQFQIRLFICTAVAKTNASRCSTCTESVTLDCVWPGALLSTPAGRSFGSGVR
jgi:hypothetical protein